MMNKTAIFNYSMPVFRGILCMTLSVYMQSFYVTFFKNKYDRKFNVDNQIIQTIYLRNRLTIFGGCNSN